METGYARMVANFETITIVLHGLGASYDPGQEMIKFPVLAAKLVEAKEILREMDDAQAEFAVAVDAGEALFKDVRRFAVNIKRAAIVELNDDAFTSGLQSIINRISQKSNRAAAVEVPVGGVADPAAKQRSGPNAGRDAKLALLGDMSALLRTRSDYRPAEPSITIAGIEQKIAELNAANVRIRTAAERRASIAERRDALMFDPISGITRRVKLIKAHLARTPGSSSVAYRRVNAISIK